MQQAQLGYNYLKYDQGWPVVLEGIMVQSSAAMMSRLPDMYMTFILGMNVHVWPMGMDSKFSFVFFSH